MQADCREGSKTIPIQSSDWSRWRRRTLLGISIVPGESNPIRDAPGGAGVLTVREPLEFKNFFVTKLSGKIFFENKIAKILIVGC